MSDVHLDPAGQPLVEKRVELPFKPFPHQRAAHAMRLTVRFLVLVWHRRAGKTVFAILELLLAALACSRPSGRFGYIAPQLKQAKIVAWDYLKHYARFIPGCDINESELQVTLPNGAKVRLFGADNPDSFRGIYLDGVVLDEIAQMKPEVWGEIIRPALADRKGWALFIGTPKGVNLFSELYFRALKGEDGWGADMKRAHETGVIPADELEKARREMSPPQYAQEFDCDFAAAADNVLMSLADVLAATKRSMMGHEYVDEVKVLGVDVARFGSDRSVIQPRQGKVAFVPHVFRKLDTMQLAGQVAMVISKWEPDATFVDVTGVGAGVVDRLKQLKFNVVGVDFGESATKSEAFFNKRTEMWWNLALWVKSGVCLPDDQSLVRELTAPTYSFTPDNRIKLETKDEMRERGLDSPDLGDALALTFAQPVSHRGVKGELERIRLRLAAGMPSGNSVNDYDPLGA